MRGSSPVGRATASSSAARQPSKLRKETLSGDLEATVASNLAGSTLNAAQVSGEQLHIEYLIGFEEGLQFDEGESDQLLDNLRTLNREIRQWNPLRGNDTLHLAAQYVYNTQAIDGLLRHLRSTLRVQIRNAYNGFDPRRRQELDAVSLDLINRLKPYEESHKTWWGLNSGPTTTHPGVKQEVEKLFSDPQYFAQARESFWESEENEYARRKGRAAERSDQPSEQQRGRGTSATETRRARETVSGQESGSSSGRRRRGNDSGRETSSRS